jgi:hypothetical protein
LEIRSLRRAESSEATGDAAILTAFFHLLQGQHSGQQNQDGAHNRKESVRAHA